MRNGLENLNGQWRSWKLTVEVEDGSVGDKPCCVRGLEGGGGGERDGGRDGEIEREGRRRRELYTQF